MNYNIDNMKKYSKFIECLKYDKLIKKINCFSSFAYQGCYEVNNFILISAYDTGYELNNPIKNKNTYNSIIEVINTTGIKKTLNLDAKLHAGGIAYDKRSNKVFVSGNKYVNVIDSDYILNLGNGDTIHKYIKKDLDITTSYLTTYTGNLYVGEFSNHYNTTLIKYSIDFNGNIEFFDKYIVPFKRVQGMCVYNFDNQNYYLFSTSYGRYNDSKLIVAQECYIDGKKTFRKLKDEINMPCMMEQISISNEGDLIIVFESDCDKYNGADNKGYATTQIPDICYLDIKKLLM